MIYRKTNLRGVTVAEGIVTIEFAGELELEFTVDAVEELLDQLLDAGIAPASAGSFDRTPS